MFARAGQPGVSQRGRAGQQAGADGLRPPVRAGAVHTQAGVAPRIVQASSGIAAGTHHHRSSTGHGLQRLHVEIVASARMHVGVGAGQRAGQPGPASQVASRSGCCAVIARAARSRFGTMRRPSRPGTATPPQSACPCPPAPGATRVCCQPCCRSQAALVASARRSPLPGSQNADASSRCGPRCGVDALKGAPASAGKCPQVPASAGFSVAQPATSSNTRIQSFTKRPMPKRSQAVRWPSRPHSAARPRSRSSRCITSSSRGMRVSM